MKVFLILINNGPSIAPYHLGLGKMLKLEGHKVIYAFTDYLPIYTHNIDLKDECYYIFSDYFKKNYNNQNINEKYSGINLWKTFFPDYDRNTVHHHIKTYKNDYTERLLANLINFFDEIFRTHNVDFFSFESISNCFVYMCYEVAKQNNAQYCGYAGSRLPNRFELWTEEFGIVEKFRNEFESLNIEEVDKTIIKEVENYLEKYQKIIPSYHPVSHPVMAKYSFFKRYLNFEKLRLIKAAIYLNIKKRKSIKYSYEIGNPINMLMKFFIYQIKRRLRIFFGKYYFGKPVLGEKYILFPLNMKPESSTSVLARHYCDDIAVIKNIAFNLPMGCKLYVKEHFVNAGNLPLKFYKELKKIPNLRLLSSNTNTRELIQNSKALIVLTSTMGFEALLMHKKVIVLGNVIYQCHPNCTKIKNFDELFPILNNIQDPVKDEEISKKFIAAYYKSTYEGNIYYTTYKHMEIKKFTDPFINALKHEYVDKEVV